MTLDALQPVENGLPGLEVDPVSGRVGDLQPFFRVSFHVTCDATLVGYVSVC